MKLTRFIPVLAATMLLGSCGGKAAKYTQKSAIEAVATLLNNTLQGGTITPSQDETDGTWYVALSFGTSLTVAQVEQYAPALWVPEDFTFAGEEEEPTWQVETYQEVEYHFIDYVCEKVGLEYMTYVKDSATIFQVASFAVK